MSGGDDPKTRQPSPTNNAKAVSTIDITGSTKRCSLLYYISIHKRRLSDPVAGSTQGFDMISLIFLFAFAGIIFFMPLTI